MSNKPNRRSGRTSLPPPKQAQAAAEAPKRPTTPMIVGAIVAVALVIGLVVALTTRGGDGDGGDELDAGVGVSGNGVATCAAPVDSVAPTEPVGSLAPFPSDIHKPVAVAGTPLPDFSSEMQSGEAADVALCEPAPIVSGYDYAGEPITVDPSRDGPTLVVVLAHWCPHCNNEIPVLNEWRDSGDVPDELDVVGLSTAVADDRDNFPPDEWLERMDWQWPVLADDESATALRGYGATSFPTMLFIGSDGLLKWRISGEHPVDDIQVRVDEALATEPA